MKPEIQKKLRKMYRTVPPVPDGDRISFLLKEVENIRCTVPKESSFFWFIKTQVRFIHMKVWFLQFLLFCVYTFFVCFTLQDTQGFLLLVPTAPLLVFIGTGELSRSYRYGMAELEIPSRFSLRQVLLARLIILLTADLSTLTCLLIVTAWQTYTAIHALILYGMVPCLITAYGCLWIMNRCSSTYSRYYTASYSIALSALGGISVNLWPAWYDSSAQGIWILVFCLTLGGVSLEIHKMLYHCFQKSDCLDSVSYER